MIMYKMILVLINNHKAKNNTNMDKQAHFMYAFKVSTFKLYLVNAITVTFNI